MFNCHFNCYQEDKKKIDAIDWLVFDQQQREEAMKQANAVMRSFLGKFVPEHARPIFRGGGWEVRDAYVSPMKILKTRIVKD